MPVVLWTTHEMKRSEASQSVKTILWLLTKKVAYMELDMVAEMEEDKVANIEVDTVADINIDINNEQRHQH